MDTPIEADLYQPSPEETKLLTDLFGTKFYNFKKERLIVEPVWDEADAMLSFDPMEYDIDDWRARTRTTKAFTLVQEALSEVAGQALQPELLPQEPSDVEKTLFVKKTVEFTYRKGKAPYILTLAMMDALKYGNGICHEFYRYETRKVQEIDEKKLIVQAAKEGVHPSQVQNIPTNEVTAPFFDDVYFDHVPIREFFPDPHCRDMDSMHQCFRVRMMHYEDFMRIFDRYTNKKYVVARGMNQDYFNNDDFSDESTNMELVEVREYWNDYKDQYYVWANDVIITPINSMIPYAHKKIPFFDVVCDMKSSTSFYKVGKPEQIKQLVEQISTLDNMRLDQIKVDLFSPLILNRQLNIDAEQLNPDPGALVLVDDLGTDIRANIYSPPKTGIMPAVYQEGERLDNDARQTTGLLGSMGIQQGRTATESAILKETMNKRLSFTLRINEMTGLDRALELRVKNIQQFYKDPVKIVEVVGIEALEAELKKMALLGENNNIGDTIEGDSQQKTFAQLLKEQKIVVPTGTSGGKPTFDVNKYRQISYEKMGESMFFLATPETIRGNFDIKVRPLSSIPVSKSLAKQQRMEFINLITTNPMISPFVDPVKVTEIVAPDYDFAPDEVFKKDLSDEQGSNLAQYENKLFTAGFAVPPTQNPTPSHLLEHYRFRTLLGLNPNASGIEGQAMQKALNEHIYIDERTLKREGYDIDEIMGAGQLGEQQGMEATPQMQEAPSPERMGEQGAMQPEMMQQGMQQPPMGMEAFMGQGQMQMPEANQSPFPSGGLPQSEMPPEVVNSIMQGQMQA